MELRTYGAASAAISRGRLVCDASVSGVIDLPTVGQIIRDIGGPNGLGQLVHVVDYSEAIVRISEHDLATVAGYVGARDGAEPIPAALVVSRGQLGLFGAYMDEARRFGVNVAVFASSAPALKWAERQVGVSQYWAECRRRASP